MHGNTTIAQAVKLMGSVTDDGLFRDVNQHTMRAYIVLLNLGYNALEAAETCFGMVAAPYIVAALTQLHTGKGGVQ